MPIKYLSSPRIEGLLRIRVIKGNNLVKHDGISHSDPYVVVTMGNQKVKTCVWNDNSNPVWNEDLTLYVKDPNVPIVLTVYDKDTFTRDDKMGDAELDIKPLLECLFMGVLQGLPNGTIVGSVQPSKKNCLAGESCIVWNNGKLTQDVTLKLRNVERGELEIQVEWLGRSS